MLDVPAINQTTIILTELPIINIMLTIMERKNWITKKKDIHFGYPLVIAILQKTKAYLRTILPFIEKNQDSYNQHQTNAP